MCENFIAWLLMPIFMVSALDNFIKQPRIITRNGHLSIIVDEDKDISLLTTGLGRIKINEEDIVQLINSMKNITNLPINRPNSDQQSVNFDNSTLNPWTTNYIQKLDNLDISYNNHTVISSMEFGRIKKRLTILQKSIRSIMVSLSRNDCDSRPCLNGGTCQNLYKSFACTCLPGWEGAVCEKDVNECAIFAGTDLGCQNGATCVNNPGSYTCVCSAGYFGTHCRSKTVDCYAGNDMCGHGACIPQASGYKCFCDAGWTTDGKSPSCTVDVNECDSQQLSCSKSPPVQCVNVPGSFYCGHCPQGYTGNGYYCNDVDECQVFNGGCSMNPIVQCINTQGSRTCGLCPPGYVGNGVTCAFQGSVCNVNNGGCHSLAQCRDNSRISSSFVECICPIGYSGNGIGPNGCQSSPSSNPCASNPCLYGTCAVDNVTRDYVCSCRRRYTGRNCNIRKNSCLSNPCLNGGTCVDVFGISYRCTCTSQYTGNNCQTERQACGGKLESLDGVLQFPLDQDQFYSHTLNCAWLIQTNSTKVLNITFTKFDIEDSKECQYDWLQIHDGRNSAAHVIGRFCGTTFPKGGNIVTNTNLVYIWFRSDSRLAKYGFGLNWTSIDPVCGGTIKVNSYGTLQSPGYPGNYPVNRDCYWVLEVDSSKRIEFHFFTLMIGNNENCTGDYLEFYYNNMEIDNRFAQFCKTSHPAPLTSPSNRVQIYFHSDSKQTYAGFQISYKVISGIPSCGGTFTNKNGQIASPLISSNPLQYQYLECEYKISVQNQMRIKIEFLTMKLMKFGSFCSEYISIYDGPTKESPLIGKYCGETFPQPYLSLGNEILIVYKGVHANTFSLKYEAVCGRKYTAPEGEITIPAVAGVGFELTNCIFEIVQPIGNIINLKLYRFSRQFSFFRPILIVRDGSNKNAPVLRKFNFAIGNPETMISTHNQLWISLSTRRSRNLYMNYTTIDIGCGGIYTNNLGTIQSPNHPGLYPNRANCKWLIEAPENHVIQLTFLNFKLEQSHSCSYDYVTIYDVNYKTEDGTQKISTFCGGKLPPTIISWSNVMKIDFRTDSSHTSEGFLASYLFVSEDNVCGGTYFTNAGIIKSPRYPNLYPINRDCKWIIHVLPGRQIMLNITDFQLEPYSKCRYDFLEIRNGGTPAAPLIGKYCDGIPKIITSHANQLFLHFKTDMTRNAKGFMIYWTSTATGCGGTLTSPRGSIISPHYPEAYSKNTECYWKISINAGSLIQIVFADLELEPHLTCYLDYIELFDGKDLAAKSLGKFCSTHPPFVRSTSNHMLIKFRSDVSFQGRGFQIQYSTVCQNTLIGYRGVIESPNFPNKYPQNEDCSWTVGVSQGNKINISFSHFELERSMSFNNVQCNFDYVEFIYRDYETEEEVKKSFCGVAVPPPITINSNTTVIHFVSDNLLMGNGFRLEWQIVGCGGILTHPTGKFRSLGFPNHYPASTRCDWIIEAPYGNSVAITFEHLDIETNSDCNYDAIEIYNGRDDKAPLMNKLCHTNKPITVTSSSHNVLVRFESDISYEGPGFEGTYEFVTSTCGGTLKASQGEFTSPNYPKNYNDGSFCEWSIEIEENHVIEFQVLDLDLLNDRNRTFLNIYDGPSSAFPLLARYRWDTNINNTIRSTYNHLFAEFRSSNYSGMTSKGFKASYKTACGALLNAESKGVINYNPISSIFYNDCEWTIMADEPEKHVSLVISRINGHYCDYEAHLLIVYNGFNNSAPEVGRYCSKLPPMITSTGNMLHINTNVGFKASYSTLSGACGGSLEGESGYIATPSYPNNYLAGIECEWVINISSSMTTTISFKSFELVDSEHCNEDFLEIRQDNNAGKLLGVFCGNNIPTNITSVGIIWMLFKSTQAEVGETATTAKGFMAEYLLEENTDLSGPSGTVYSPLYPVYYMKMKLYSWRLTVKFGYKIEITINDLSMEFGEDSYCFAASITFYDGYDNSAPMLHQYCGTPKDLESFKTTSNVIYIVASMDITRRGSRFAIDWLQVENIKNKTLAETSSCGVNEIMNINAVEKFVLKSPGYPYGYNNSLDCEWIFTTIPENHLQIEFLNVDLEYRVTCLFDRVEVYTGKSLENWKLVSTICLPNDTYRGVIDTSNLMKVVFITDSYLNQTGFNAFISDTCGGSLKKSSGIITVDNSSFSQSYQLDCQWNITVPSGRTMKIKFIKFDIGSDPKCNNYILLKNGHSADSPILGTGKYCDQSPGELLTTSNNLYMKFSAKKRIPGFLMEYSVVATDCDGKIRLTKEENTTIISSPNYPNIPLPHSECNWIISVPSGEAIQIDFIDRFDLSNTENCDKEYVEVRNGGTAISPLMGRFCKTTPSTLVTEDNMVFIKFFTDVDDPRNGFKAKISIAKCGGTIRNSTGVIRSKYYNDKSRYPQNENCTWEIQVPDGHSMQLNFETLDVFQSSKDCRLPDYVEILEQSIINNSVNSLGRFCNKNITDIQTTSNKVFVRFVTNSKVKRYNGFSLRFKAGKEKCGGILSADFGYITSPNYPVLIAAKCEWLIKVTKGRRIKAELVDFDFDNSPPTIGLAFSNSDSFVSHITLVKGGDRIKFINSSDNLMTIFYWALYSSNHRGFKLKYTSDEPTICLGDFSQPSGTIVSPANTSVYHCTWNRVDTEATQRTLALTAHIGNTSKDSQYPLPSKCKYAPTSVIVTTGKEDMELGQVCILSKKSQTIRTPYLKTDLIANHVGWGNSFNFTIDYNVYQCGGIITQPMGNITSPGFPRRTSQRVECVWLIELPEDLTIKLKFNAMDLGDDCEKSFIVIHNGNLNTSPRLGKYCRSNFPSQPLQSQSHHMWIEYHSETDTGKGFNFTYEAVTGCGGIFHDPSRLIQTPFYPEMYPNNVECLWEIRGENGYHIGLEFIDRFQLEKTDHCKNDYLQIWDYKNDDWASIAKLCGRDLPKIINSTSSNMKILFRTNEKITGSGFKAKWMLNCGGVFNATKQNQYITSPGYPNNYKDELDCVYNISAPGKRILLKFEEFSLEHGTPNCPYDKLTITQEDVMFPYRIQPKTYCGNNKPPDLEILNFISIRFKTDMFVRKSGFKFSYSTNVCGGDIYEPTDISSPKYKAERSTTFSILRKHICVWNITAPKDKVVAIKFDKIDFRLCMFNYLSIYEGFNNSIENRLGRFCGNLTNTVPIIKSTGNKMLLEYKSYIVGTNSFRAAVYFTYGPKNDCGGVIPLDTTGAKFIESPNLQGQMDCQWLVEAPEFYIIKIEVKQSPGCEISGNTTMNITNNMCGHLEIRDGASHFSERLADLHSSIEAMKTYTTSGQQAFIQWSTLDNDLRHRFKLEISVVQTLCGPTFLSANGTSAFITSPNYPNVYPDNLKCVWKINSTTPYRHIYIKLTEFDLGQDDNPSQDCTGDKLEIVDKDNRKVIDEGLGKDSVYYFGHKGLIKGRRGPVGIHQYCGKTAKHFDYFSGESNVVISFNSYSGNHGKGFKLEYKEAGGCRNYTSVQGRIYGNHFENCNFTITAPENYTIGLYFAYFALPSRSLTCNDSRMEIYDGNSTSGTQLTSICRYVLPNPIFSTKNQVFVKFHDSVGKPRRFSAYDITYTSTKEGRGCGGEIYNYQGIFTSPLYPNNYRNISYCIWNVSVPNGLRITLKFTVFDIQASCATDYVIVTTYQNDEPNLQKLCQTDTIPVFESSNKIKIEYATSYNNGGTGWLAQFKSFTEEQYVQW